MATFYVNRGSDGKIRATCWVPAPGFATEPLDFDASEELRAFFGDSGEPTLPPEMEIGNA